MEQRFEDRTLDRTEQPVDLGSVSLVGERLPSGEKPAGAQPPRPAQRQHRAASHRTSLNCCLSSAPELSRSSLANSCSRSLASSALTVIALSIAFHRTATFSGGWPSLAALVISRESSYA